jgi:hypothetical protein
VDALPPGFVEMSPEELGSEEQSFPEGTCYFNFSDNINSQLILGFLMPVTNLAEQMRCHDAPDDRSYRGGYGCRT